MPIGHSDCSKACISDALSKENSVVYFIGIGGVSMSAAAELLISWGYRVFGSDTRKSEATERLISLGADILYGHESGRILRIMPTIIVYSLAISEENVEFSEAKRLGIMLISRAELIGAIMEKYIIRIGFSGSHGKSTATALSAGIFVAGGLDPTVMAGAPIFSGSSLLPGKNKCLIYEACEYGDSFLHFFPDIAVILNIELDHTDYFADFDAIRLSFAAAANRSRLVLLNNDDPGVRSIEPLITAKKITVSSGALADYIYRAVSLGGGKYRCDIFCGNDLKLSLTPGIRGSFNLSKIVLAAVSALLCGVDADAITYAVSEFSGIPRRLEYIGSHLGADVFYDYAHHPTEITATRSVLIEMGYKSICVVFSPHTYTRTQYFFDEFADALSGFFVSLITEIYAAREMPLEGVSSAILCGKIRERGTLSAEVDEQNVVDIISSLSPDCIVLMGAGDLEKIKKRIEEN